MGVPAGCDPVIRIAASMLTCLFRVTRNILATANCSMIDAPA